MNNIYNINNGNNRNGSNNNLPDWIVLLAILIVFFIISCCASLFGRAMASLGLFGKIIMGIVILWFIYDLWRDINSFK